MRHKLGMQQNEDVGEVPKAMLSERYTSLLGREISPCIPGDSRIATLDELVQQYRDNPGLKSKLTGYCDSINQYDGWILVFKGQGYYPENVYWYYRIENGTLEHVNRKMWHDIPAKSRLTVFRNYAEHMCVKFGGIACPSGNELYIARAAYVPLNSNRVNKGIKDAKR